MLRLSPTSRSGAAFQARGLARSPGCHRSLLAPDDRTTVHGIPSVSAARVPVDIAETCGAGEFLDDVIDTLIVRRLTTAAAIAAAADRASRAPGRRGLPALATALEPWFGEGIPDSVPEMKLVRRLLRWGFPPPERQMKVFANDGRLLGKVDVGWRPYRAGIEYDGRVAHAPRKWMSDEAREEAIEALGYRLLRADKFDLRPSATRLRDELRQFVPLQPPAA